MFGHTNEAFALERDVKAVIIPAGEELLLREGTAGFITQSLGGSFTIYVEGNLFRIAGVDADDGSGERRSVRPAHDPGETSRARESDLGGDGLSPPRR